LMVFVKTGAAKAVLVSWVWLQLHSCVYLKLKNALLKPVSYEKEHICKLALCNVSYIFLPIRKPVLSAQRITGDDVVKPPNSLQDRQATCRCCTLFSARSVAFTYRMIAGSWSRHVG
jgi:hypothetical protein